MQLREARHRLRHHFRHIRRLLGHHAPWRLPHLDPIQVGKNSSISTLFILFFNDKYRQASNTCSLSSLQVI